jgi:hypothetical protein
MVMDTLDPDHAGTGAHPVGTPPPRWKLAVLAWAGACPTVAVLDPALGPGLAWLHPFLRTALIVAIMIGMMTYVWMPLLTRIFSTWLRRQRRSPAEAARRAW